MKYVEMLIDICLSNCLLKKYRSNKIIKLKNQEFQMFKPSQPTALKVLAHGLPSTNMKISFFKLPLHMLISRQICFLFISCRCMSLHFSQVTAISYWGGGAIGTWTWNWNMELKLLAQTRTLKLQFRMCMHVLYFHKIILVQHSMHLRNGWKFNLYLWCNLFKIKSYIHDARAHAQSQSNLGEDLLSLKGCLQWLGPRAQGPLTEDAQESHYLSQPIRGEPDKWESCNLSMFTQCVSQ